MVKDFLKLGGGLLPLVDPRRRLDPEERGAAEAPVPTLAPTVRKPSASVPAS